LPGYLVAGVPRYRGASLPGCLVTGVPRYRGASLPGCLVTRPPSPRRRAYSPESPLYPAGGHLAPTLLQVATTAEQIAAEYRLPR
jgi:hypothetical protein